MNTKNIYQISLLCFIAVLWSCEADPIQKLENRSWALTWSDEFEGQKNQAPDPKK